MRSRAAGASAGETEQSWVAEAALALVTTAIAFTSLRLFRDASFLPRALLVVALAHGAAIARRPVKCYRLVGVRFARIAIERYRGCCDLHGIRARRGYPGRLQVDLHFSGTADFAGVRDEVARAPAAWQLTDPR